MTIATIKKNNNIVQFTIEGHAGDVIVCSAISTISQGIIKGLDEVLRAQGHVTIADGYISYKLSEGNSDAIVALSQTLLKTLELVLVDISKSYPDNLLVVTEMI